MAKPTTIAIDGPASSGKSTVSELLADKLDFLFIDTGAFYRAITYYLLQNKVTLSDSDAVDAALMDVDLRFQRGDEVPFVVLLNGEDVTDHLRTREVELRVSQVAKMPTVRAWLLPMQRKFAEQGKIILAGRDIGTVVLPDADLKIYIDASLQERARRRHQQRMQSGKREILETVEIELAQRDKTDSERSHSPLARASDAVYINTDGKTPQEVIQYILEIIERWPQHLPTEA